MHLLADPGNLSPCSISSLYSLLHASPQRCEAKQIDIFLEPDALAHGRGQFLKREGELEGVTKVRVRAPEHLELVRKLRGGDMADFHRLVCASRGILRLLL